MNPHGRKRDQPWSDDPSPGEIEAATAEIRREWSENEHRRRAGFEPLIPSAEGRAAQYVYGMTVPFGRVAAY